jgi:OmpA-OmpF porin, OOP family
MNERRPATLRRHLGRVAGPLAFVLLCSVPAACMGTGSAATKAPACKPSSIAPHDDKTLVVEGDPWSGYAAFRNPDLLNGTGYGIQYVEQLCQKQRAVEITSGQADFEVTTLDQVVLNHPAGKVVGLIDQSEGADALALNTVDLPYLQSIDDLRRLVREYKAKGKKPVLAYTGNSPSQMLRDELANTTEEFRLTDFELVSVDESSSALKMLENHTAQLAIIWEPDTTTAKAEHYTIALSSKDVPDSIIDVIVASASVLQRDPAAVKALISSYYAFMDDKLANSAALQSFLAKDANMNDDAAASVIKGIKLYGSADADAFMNQSLFPLDQPQLAQSVKALGAVLALNNPDVDPSQTKIDGSFLPSVTAGAGTSASPAASSGAPKG